MPVPHSPPPPESLAVRPVLRVLGAVLLGGIAWLFVSQAWTLFEHRSAIDATCTSGSGRATCELGGWLLRAVPAPWQGPVMGATLVGIGGVAVLAAVGLLKPLLAEALAEDRRRGGV